MDANSPDNPKPPQFTLAGLLVLTAVVALVLGVTLPAVDTARAAARRSQCVNNLKQIGLALHNYHDAYRCFPPAYIPDEMGQPRCSWRVLESCFLVAGRLHDSYNFNEPWNSPGNLKADSTWGGHYHATFHCPNHSTALELTTYLAVVGQRTAWPAPRPCKFLDFRQGASESILLVEKDDSGIRWIEPRDLQFDRLEFTIHARPRWGGVASPTQSRSAMSSAHPDGANALFGDGAVKFLAASTSAHALQDMLVIDGGQLGSAPDLAPKADEGISARKPKTPAQHDRSR